MPAVMAGIALADAPNFFVTVLFFIGILGLSVYFKYLKKHRGKRAVMYDLVIILIPVMMLLGRKTAENALSRPSIGCEIDKKSEISSCGTISDRSLQDGKAVLTVRVDRIEHPEEASRVYYEQVILVYSDDSVVQPLVKVGDRINFSAKLYPLKKATNPGQFDMQSYCRARKIDGKAYGALVEVQGSGEKGGIGAGIGELLARIRIRIDESLTKYFFEQDAGVLRAMLTGDKSLMDDDLNELYRQAGIGHILAISGLHISMIGLFIFEFLKKLGVSLKTDAFVSETAVVLYCIMTGMSISALRALVMFSCVMLSRSLGKSYDALSAMGLAGTVLLLIKPLQMFEAGFVLSFVSVVGIATFEKPSKQIAFYVGARLQDRLLLWNKKFTESLEKVIANLISGFCLYLVMLPVIAWFYFEVSPYSFLINLLILPFMSPLVAGAFVSAGIGMAASWLGGLFVPLEKVLGIISVFAGSVPHFILSGYRKIAEFAVSLPGGVILTGRPNFVVMLMCVISIIAVCLFVRKKTKMLALLLVSLVVLVVRIPISDGVTFLDVGQGDCSIIRSGGRTVMIDGGSSDNSSVGKYVISQFLKYYGISRVDYCVVTHPDSDHMNGVVELVKGMECVEKNGGKRRRYKGAVIIENLILPDVSGLDDDFSELLGAAGERKIAITRIHSGMKLVTDEDCVFECLNPDADVHYDSTNSASVVLLLRWGAGTEGAGKAGKTGKKSGLGNRGKEISVLFAGDVENEGEDEVIKALKGISAQEADGKGKGYRLSSGRKGQSADCEGGDGKARISDGLSESGVTVYKAAHHGSSNGTNSKELINLTRPETTIISCGRNNRYNHPHEQTVERLKDAGSRILITWEEGAITLNGGNIKSYAK